MIPVYTFPAAREPRVVKFSLSLLGGCQAVTGRHPIRPSTFSAARRLAPSGRCIWSLDALFFFFFFFSLFALFFWGGGGGGGSRRIDVSPIEINPTFFFFFFLTSNSSKVSSTYYLLQSVKQFIQTKIHFAY